MTPWCDHLVCSWRRLLADRHSLPFPWTLSLRRRWCPSACHHPLTFLFLLALTFPLPSPFPSLGLSLRRPQCPGGGSPKSQASDKENRAASGTRSDTRGPGNTAATAAAGAKIEGCMAQGHTKSCEGLPSPAKVMAVLSSPKSLMGTLKSVTHGQ